MKSTNFPEIRKESEHGAKEETNLPDSAKANGRSKPRAVHQVDCGGKNRRNNQSNPNRPLENPTMLRPSCAPAHSGKQIEAIPFFVPFKP